MSAGQKERIQKAAKELGRSAGQVSREAIGLWLWLYSSGKLPTLRAVGEEGQMEIVSPGAT